MDVTQKKELGVEVFRRDTRLELVEDVQFGEISLGLVQIIRIMSTPAKGLAFCAVDSADIHAARFQDFFVLGGEVVSHHGKHAHVGEVAGGHRKICG